MSQPAPPTVGELGPDDLVDVLTELLDASVNWENIGLGLRLSPGILQALNVPNKLPWDCLRDMLREWLNRSPDPSWQSLIRALRSPIVGKGTLASYLEAKYCAQEGSVPPSGTVIATPNHPSPVCMATHVSSSRTLQMQPENSANALPTLASLVISESCSDQSERQLHPNENGSKYLLPPSKGVNYSSESPADDLTISRHEGGASEGKSRTLPLYSPLPETQQVWSSSGPDSLEQPPSYLIAGIREGQLPPEYPLPHLGPMITTHHFPLDPFPPCGVKTKPRQVSGSAGVHIPTLQGPSIEQVSNSPQRYSQVPPPSPSILSPGVRGSPLQVRRQSSPPNPPSSPKVSMPKFGQGNEGAIGSTLNHLSPVCTSEQVSYSKTQPATSANALPTLASLVISESHSDESERQLHASESGHDQCLPPSKGVKYSSGSRVDTLATSKQGDRASKGESHVLPSYSRSPLPEPQQVRSSSGPDTLQQPPFHGKPPSIPVAGESEGQLPPWYSLPHPAPMDMNSTRHFPPSSLDPRFQPQEVQQVYRYPHYQISTPTHGSYLVPTPGQPKGQFGDLLEPQIVRSLPFQVSGSELVMQLPPCGPYHRPSSQSQFPRSPLRSNPVSQLNESQPPPGYCPPASVPIGRGNTAPNGSLLEPHSVGPSPLPEQNSGYQTTPTAASIGVPPAEGQPPRGYFPGSQQVPHLYSQAPPCGPSYPLHLPESQCHLPPGLPPPSDFGPGDYSHGQQACSDPEYFTAPPVGPEVDPVPVQRGQQYSYRSQHPSQVSATRYGFGASQGVMNSSYTGSPRYPSLQNQYSPYFGRFSNLPLHLHSHNHQFNQVQQFPGNFSGSPGYPYPQNQYSVSSGRFSNPPFSTHRYDLPLNQVQRIPGFVQSFRHVSLDQLGPFADYLRETYRVQIPGFFAIQWPPPPTRKVFNLSLIHSETIRCTAPNDELVRLLMTGCVPEYVRRNTSVELKDLFRLESEGRKFVLIEGAPGSGKSTLAWHIVQTWKAQELFQEFKVVIYVQLRDPEIQAAQSVADLLPTDSEERKKDAVFLMRSCCGKGVLFVLDGWDEYPLGLQRGSLVQKLICNPQMLDLQFSTLLVTSRPITSAVLHGYASSRVEVVGFTPVEVRQYFKETLGDAMSVQNLEDQLKERPTVEASCFLPLNAAIVVHLFRELNHVLPPTLHGIFSALVCGCLVRHLRKQSDGNEIPEIPSLEEIPLIIQKPFESVCTLAYRGAMNDKVTFSHRDLSSYKLSAGLNVLSLMQGVQSFASRKSMLYHFLHLSVQELLAARHISKLPQSEQVQVFKELFNQPRFAAVFRFYAAFTKLQTEGIRDVVTSIVRIQSLRRTHFLNLLHCLYESQDSSLCSFVASQLNGSLDLSRSTLSPLDCLSVGYFLSCVCQTTEGKFKVKLRGCSLNDYSVAFLVQELSKCDCPSPPVEGAAARIALPGCLALDLTLNRRMGGCVRCLSELISHSNAVSKLDLSGNAIQEDGDGLKYLLQGLRTNTSIVEVDLAFCSLRVTEDNGPLLVEMLRDNTTLKVLNFNHNTDLLTSGLDYLGRGLCCNVGLVQLSLYQCGVTGNEAKSLAKALMENTTVKSLNLSGNKLGSSSLKLNSTLQKLNLWDCSLSAEDINDLVDSLLSSRSLLCLDLSDNPISDAAAAHIANLLKHNTRLTEVKLASCNITHRGAQSLAAALREHNSLKVLVLSENMFLDAGGVAIAKALRYNHKLRHLSIGSCGLTDQCMGSIATALEVNTTLETLGMSFNRRITDRGLLTLGESLKRNKGLKSLRLFDLEQITIGGWKLFVLCLKENHHLTSLTVSFMSIESQIQQEVVAVNEARQQQGLTPLKWGWCVS